MDNIFLDPCVEEELWAIWEYIAKDNPDAATRVVDAVHETLTMLAAQPELGVPRTFRHPRLRNIRSFRVAGFEKYLIFYRVVTNGIEVLHVYHGARDLEALFGKDF